jgi:hypothetical protein
MQFLQRQEQLYLQQEQRPYLQQQCLLESEPELEFLRLPWCFLE